MDTTWTGRLVGEFWGYKGGRVYSLDDGSRWEQQDNTDDPIYRHDPAARLIYRRDVNETFLDVEGTSAMVRVVRCGSKPTPRVGAV